jgi:hypothetical protein
VYKQQAIALNNNWHIGQAAQGDHVTNPQQSQPSNNPFCQQQQQCDLNAMEVNVMCIAAVPTTSTTPSPKKKISLDVDRHGIRE